jgi:hypothetical protein
MDNELYMQMSTVVLNNWDVRISIFDCTQSVRVATYTNEKNTAGFPIEIEYVTGGFAIGKE